MGRLVYGDSAVTFRFDDRTLAHLQVVIGAKLRRREGFYCSWRDDADTGGGRSSVWMDSSIPLYFGYASSERQVLNRVWLDGLTRSANTTQGLYLTPEPVDAAAQPAAQPAAANTPAVAVDAPTPAGRPGIEGGRDAASDGSVLTRSG